MKFTVRAEVDSAIVLRAPTIMTLNSRRVDFGIDGNSVWNSVTITAEVVDVGKFKWGLEPVVPVSARHAPVNIHAKFDPELYDQIRKDMQNLESSIALMFPLRRIHWESPKLNIIFEHAAEENPADWAPLTDFKAGRGKRQPVQPPDEDFQSFALLSTRHSTISVILSFWREGSNDFEEGHFINAFYNYYFVLEGIYANGQFRKDSVLAEFKKNSELRESLDKFLCNGSPMKYIHQVTQMMTSRQLTLDADGVLKLIVNTRGELHHFGDNPNRVEPSLFQHHKFEGIAFLMRFISRQALLSKMMVVNNTFAPPA